MNDLSPNLYLLLFLGGTAAFLGIVIIFCLWQNSITESKRSRAAEKCNHVRFNHKIIDLYPESEWRDDYTNPEKEIRLTTLKVRCGGCHEIFLKRGQMQIREKFNH